MKIVAIAGGFDPLHEGHLDHIIKAAKLGDYLLVLVSNDADMIRKKGRCNIPLEHRIRIVELILKGLGIPGIVRPTMDTDGTQTNTLLYYLPDILAKGGDRTPINMPKNELLMCKALGIEIVYGIGDLLNSSSKMVM